jgi:hypothetical protein
LPICGCGVRCVFPCHELIIIVAEERSGIIPTPTSGSPRHVRFYY